MSLLLKRQIPLAITFFVGILVSLNYVVKFDPLDPTGTLKSYAVVISSFLILVGTAWLFRFQYRSLRRKVPGLWYANAVAIFGFILFLVVGLATGTNSASWNWITSNIYSSLVGALQALVAFLFISATYRAFKVRTLESWLLVIPGVLVMLSNAPIGEYLWAPLGPIGRWIVTNPNSAAQRGILIASAVGALAMSIRTILGWQRAYLTASAGEKEGS